MNVRVPVIGVGYPATPRARVTRRLTLLPLIAATYFMVAGGPYGLEDLLQKAGYPRTLLILLITPLIWSLPTALMVGELSGALPEEGGYYAWVRRAMGPFWGFQEAWLSLASSIFDMAIYPTIFVLYLVQLFPALKSAHAVPLFGSLMIIACTAWNLAGSRAVGRSSVGMMVVLLAPFAVMVVLATRSHPAVHATAAFVPETSVFAGILIAMWNFMGWDSASTVAGEVEKPQRNYPLTMMLAVALVAFTYVMPVVACWHAGIDPSRWTTGSWSEGALTIGGRALATAVALGGVLCGIGMFNALMMANTRLPFAMAEDRLLPAAFARRHPKTDAPWVSVLACAAAWMACLGLGFEKLVQLDVLLYGLSLLLEFVALVILRVREPELPRSFRVPGGLLGAIGAGVGPLVLLTAAAAHEGGQWKAFGIFGACVAAGPALYFLVKQNKRPGTSGLGEH